MGTSVHIEAPYSAATVAAPPRAAPVQRGRAWAPRVVALAAAGLLFLTLAFLPYYSAPIAARARDAWHPWLRPSGYVGQTAGIIAFLIFSFLWLYPLRKKVRWLAFTGAVGRWLDVHVATALLLPLIVGLHAGWRFEGLIGLGYAAMLVVCASGVVGRYLYARIPRSKSGVELDRAEVAQQRRAMLTEIAAATKLTPDEVERRLATPSTARDTDGIIQTFVALVRDDVARIRAVGRFRREISGLDPAAVRQVARLASREAALSQQARMLSATQRVFRFWHVAHRPFAVTALIAVVVHVAVVVAFGATWFW